MAKQWTPDALLDLARSFQPACVVAAAVDWDVFGVLSARPLTAAEVASELGTDPRATTVLLDALTALELLDKEDQRYRVPECVRDALTATGARSVLPMLQHQANCLRRWAQLPEVLRSGKPGEQMPSVRGAAADQAAFIGAMHTISGPTAEQIVRSLWPLKFKHLLDVGGASGTWTMAFLGTMPEATATLFDLPAVIPLAKARLGEAGLADRVRLIAGDFYADALPAGADLAWVSAIIHQNSRAQNRQLFAKVFAALEPGGRIAIRDLVMNEAHTKPAGGALFSVNMLVATPGGGTFTLGQISEDLASAGFGSATLLRRDPAWMNSVVSAEKPGR